MPLSEIFQNIEQLKRELDSYRPLPNNVLNTLNYRLRLDWNYHSNKMEGGTLTFEETRSVMMAQLNINGKPLRDVLEMHGHDEVVKNIQKMGEGVVKMTENRIKEIHKTIIHADEDTPERFKNRNNYIYNHLGERFDFLPHEQTIEAMNSLTNWLDNQLRLLKKGKSAQSLPEIAFEYHLRFLTIHPFLDGNGRTARILSNLIAIAHGYPPVIVRTEEKEIYNKLLVHAQQYEQNPIPFYEFLGNLMVRSFELCLKAAKGDNIFEKK